jgi:very-short-patch-repair endonuclease
MRENRQPVELARRLRQHMTPQEVKLWNWLRESIVPQGFHFRRQVALNRFIVDFACIRAKIVIEIDGSQHGSDEGLRRDNSRDEALVAMGFRILRFWNHEVDRDKQVVLDTIFHALQDRLPPSAAYGGTSPASGEGSGVEPA